MTVLISVTYFSKNKTNILANSFNETIKITGYVYLLVIASTIFSLFLNYFYTLNINIIFSNKLLTDIFIYSFIIILLGFFMEFIEISIIFVPIFLAFFLENYSINSIDFLILTALLLQLSFLTPPFGWTIFYLSGLYPATSTFEIIKVLIPLNILLFIFIVLFIFYSF